MYDPWAMFHGTDMGENLEGVVETEDCKVLRMNDSSGGKTTLCHLITRFWDVDKGSVKLEGVDVKEYSMDSLMRNFSRAAFCSDGTLVHGVLRKRRHKTV